MKETFYIIFFIIFFCIVRNDVAAQCAMAIDVDGNVYNTVKIGEQCWMKENLKTTHFSDGSAINEMQDSALWVNTSLTHAPAMSYYDNNIQNNFTYGALYNWYAVTDKRNLCPTGWHVPSNDEFQILSDYLGGDDISGSHLKDITLWSVSNSGNDNSSGFTALPAGLRYHNGGFYGLGENGDFWSSTGGSSRAWNRSLFYRNPSADRFHDYEEDGLSVRCVGD